MESQTRITSLVTLVNELESERKNESTELIGLREEVKTLKEIKNTVQVKEDNDYDKIQIEKIQKDYNILLQNYNTQIQELNNLKKISTEDLESSKRLNDSSINEIENLKGQIKLYETKVANLEKSLQQEKEHWSLEIAVLKQLNENPNSNDTLNEFQKLKQEITTTREENNNLKEQVKDLQDQLQKNQIELLQSNESKNLIQKQLSDKNKALEETYKKECDQIKNMNTKLTEQVLSLEAKKNLFLILSLILSIITAVYPIFTHLF